MDENRKNGIGVGRIALTGLLAGLALGLSAGWVALRSEPTGTALDRVATRGDPEFAEALHRPEALRRAGHVARLLQDLGPLDLAGSDSGSERLEAIRRAFETAPIPNGDPEFALFAAWWTRSDPSAAAAWMGGAPQAASISVLAAVLHEWGREDPTAAIRFAQEETFEVRRRPALSAALMGVASQPLFADRLLEFAAEIEDRADRRTAIEAVSTQRLRTQEIPTVVDWAKSLTGTSEELRVDFIAGTAIAIARRDPERAIESLKPLAASSHSEAQPPHAKQMGAEATHEGIPKDVVSAIAALWSERDPHAAIEWLAEIGSDKPSTDEFELVVREAYQKWILADRDAALAWVAQRDSEEAAWFNPIRATAGLIVGQTDPAEGLRMLFKLPVERERAFKVQRVFAKWKQDAPEAAERWLLEADLPENRKQALRDAPLPSRPMSSDREAS